MNHILPPTLYWGRDYSPPESIPLRAGPLTMLYEDGGLRYIKVGQHEIVRRIYVAVRDHNWETIEANISIQHKSVRSDSFSIEYHARHKQNDIEFVWDGAISGDAGGILHFSMKGEALSTFWRNRIGFCVLHPMACAGTDCVIEHQDGTIVQSVFPVEIAPHQPFQDIRAITHVVQPGLNAEVRFTGDTFEMEDQRNWTDASYKTYCTPLDLPFPVNILAGTKIQQSVDLRLIGNAQFSSAKENDQIPEPVRIVIENEVAGRLPRLGLCVASHQQPLSSLEIRRLRDLNLSHLRVDVYFKHADWEARFQREVLECEEVSVALEVALHLTDRPEQELAALRRILNVLKPKIAAWLLFDKNGNSSPPEMISVAHEYLKDYSTEALFGGGTDAFFAQLNRNRPSLSSIDVISYSLNPQVHAFDNASLVETLPAQTSTLSSARQFSDGRLLAVSPVTLRMRFNPAATKPNSDPGPHLLPSQVDPRQMTLLGAAWTLGSIKYLAEGGAYSVTYYETTGWLGVMETYVGSPLPDKFPSIPGSVFPMYHVFANMGEWANAEVLKTSSTDPLTSVGMTLQKQRHYCVFVVNFSARSQQVELIGLQGSLRLKMLNEFTAQEAMTKPAIYRSQIGQMLEAVENKYSFELAPFAVADIFIEKTKGD